jgi:hypothetical protein
MRSLHDYLSLLREDFVPSSKVCSIFSSDTTPFRDLKALDDDDDLEKVHRSLEMWSMYGRRGMTPSYQKVMETIFSCPSRKPWSKAASGTSVFRGVWRTPEMLKKMNIRLTKSVLFPLDSSISNEAWIYGTGTYTPAESLHSWTKLSSIAGKFAEGKFVRKDYTTTTASMIMHYKVTDPSKTIDLEKVSIDPASDFKEKEVVLHGTGNMTVQFALRLDQLIVKDGKGKPTAEGTEEMLNRTIGGANAEIVLNDPRFNKKFSHLFGMARMAAYYASKGSRG